MENNCQLNKATKDSAPPSDYEEAEGLYTSLLSSQFSGK